MKIDIVCKQTNQKTAFDGDLNNSVPIAKEMLRKALALGHKDPKVRIYGPYSSVPWLVVSKKDVAEPMRVSQKLTQMELAVLKRIVAMYESSGVDNTAFSTLFDESDDSKKMRGVVASLTRKQVVNRNDCPECFNPIYPSYSFVATCRAYGIAIPKRVEPYL